VKKCFKCHRYLSMDCFYKHPMMADGTLNKCKECARADVRRNRKSNIEYYRDYDKKRYKEPLRRAASLAAVRRRKREEPLKNIARCAVYRAVKSGKLKRLPCQVCGGGDSHAHHADYSRPLDVAWLCERCHVEHGHGGHYSRPPVRLPQRPR
jgi:hypothetical protein